MVIPYSIGQIILEQNLLYSSYLKNIHLSGEQNYEIKKYYYLGSSLHVRAS